MVIELLLAALALAAAGSTVAAIRRRRRADGEEEPPPALMAPRQLAQGELLPRDVITHLGADYLVEGVATFKEGGRPVLVLAYLTDGSDRHLLLVDLADKPRYTLGEARDVGAHGRSVPSWVPDGPLELGLTRRAAVRVSCQGKCQDVPSPEGACEFGVYSGPGQRKAAMLISGAGELLLVGRGVTEAGLVLLPGGSAVNEGV